ncbi:hypothetical protein GCM10007094_23060 [Pseudovibrio japonicus]|uniref:Uncharacterized protein n=1 Tax=Pseudovibrio japonicus TaxID=366534 RepID=A0ABQ3EG02_9HYPH|nr:hypothetical protein [Pseudovibrio japonicus]GHB33662.1 hypothetical protein GCM10007094_23060 [Pseudovibrio japonicus]
MSELDITIKLTEANVKDAVAEWLNRNVSVKTDWTRDNVQLVAEAQVQGYGPQERTVHVPVVRARTAND